MSARYQSPRERLVERQRQDEARQADLRRYAAATTMARVVEECEDGVVARRLRNEAATLEYEAAMEAASRSALRVARDKARARELEEAAEAERARRQGAEDAKRREVAKILREDASLRGLQEKLKLAYIVRARKEQLAEKEAVRCADVAVERGADAVMEANRAAALEAEAARREALRAQYVAGRVELEGQLKEKAEREAADAAEAVARERALVAAIMARVAEEDACDAAARAAAREETRKAIDDFRRQHERAKAASEAAEIEEGLRIRAFLEAQDARVEKEKKNRAAEAAARDAAYASVVAEQAAGRKKAEEEEQLRWLLVEEETEQRRAREEAARAAAVERSRREMLAANEEQRRIRDALARQEAAKEAALIEQFLAKCVEDDKKEQLARKARLEARARYMEEVHAQRNERAVAVETRRLEEQRALVASRAAEEFRSRVVQEARRQMLREHAAVLRGNMPRGVILSQDDADLIKAFDANGDGTLTADEMELAQAAFKAGGSGGGASSASSGRPR